MASQEDMYAIYSKETAHTLVMFNSVDSVAQMTNVSLALHQFT